jgi:hypothetical protein
MNSENRSPVSTSLAGARRANRASRETASLVEPFSRRFAAYALGASATGVGLLALAQPARAEIVFTPANTTLTNGSLYIDLNHDGINDFVLLNDRSSPHHRALGAKGLAAGNGVMAYQTGCSYPLLALRPGTEIGTARELFCRSAAPMAGVASTFGGVIFGPWANISQHFLGFKFEINRQVHYGWAELNVKAGPRNGAPAIAATLLGYAYDTVPNQPVPAGLRSDACAPKLEPGTLGLLALGSPGLAFWRKKEQPSEVAP